MRSHWFVARTVPSTSWPVTAQVRSIFSPVATLPVTDSVVAEPERRLTAPAELLTVPTTYRATPEVPLLAGTTVGLLAAQRESGRAAFT